MRACLPRCRRGPLGIDERVYVGSPFSNSGPGGPPLFACLSCARVYTRWTLAPAWLAEEIGRTEARLGHRDPP